MSGSTLNNLSIVTRLDCGPHSFLFTADIEAEAWARLRLARHSIPARILKVPHHGARSSLDARWIGEARPEIAVISVGAFNPYGHPSPEVLAAYQENGVRLFRTDRQGAVQITGTMSSSQVQVEAARDDQLEPVRLGPLMLTAERQNLVRFWRLWTAAG